MADPELRARPVLARYFARASSADRTDSASCCSCSLRTFTWPAALSDCMLRLWSKYSSTKEFATNAERAAERELNLTATL